MSAATAPGPCRRLAGEAAAAYERLAAEVDAPSRLSPPQDPAVLAINVADAREAAGRAVWALWQTLVTSGAAGQQYQRLAGKAALPDTATLRRWAKAWRAVAAGGFLPAADVAATSQP